MKIYVYCVFNIKPLYNNLIINQYWPRSHDLEIRIMNFDNYLASYSRSAYETNCIYFTFFLFVIFL